MQVQHCEAVEENSGPIFKDSLKIKALYALVGIRKDMFNVSSKVFIEFGLQLTQLLLSLPHVFLQLQT